jgi:hypothetical protein
VPHLDPQQQASKTTQDQQHTSEKSVGENPFVGLVQATNPFTDGVQRRENPFLSQIQVNTHAPNSTTIIQRDEKEEVLRQKLDNWKGNSLKNINIDSFKLVLSELISSKDTLSFNTLEYILDATNAGSLEIQEGNNLKDEEEAKAARSAHNKFIIFINTKNQLKAKVLVHEVNHIKNEVADSKVIFSQNPYAQFVTEFRAYFVAGNWPVTTDQAAIDFSKKPKNQFKHLNSFNIRSFKAHNNNNSNNEVLSTNDSEKQQTQVAFNFIRKRILENNGQGISDDTEDEKIIRERLAEIIKTHILKHYEYSHPKKPKDTVKQDAFLRDFIDKGVLLGNVSNENKAK